MPPPDGRQLWPNIGAEEGDPKRAAKFAPVVATRRLWGGLFDRTTRWADPDFAAEEASTCGLHAEPALGALSGLQGFVPWLATPEAEQAAQAASVPFAGAPSAVVARVHDKAFAVRHAREERFGPAWLGDAIRVLDAEDIPQQAPGLGEFAAELAAQIRGWPAEHRPDQYVLKPRLGTSGRGLQTGPIATASAETVERGLARLTGRNGVILEPYLNRVSDLSVVLWLSRPGEAADAPPLTVVAGLRQIIDEGHVWRGHLGEIDRRGRIYSGTRHDDVMREAGASIALAAHADGFHGACGVDGFSYVRARSGRPGEDREPDAPETLRPIVEFNARFTMGHVCAGWLRRTLPWLVAERGLAPGRRVAFLFALAPPGRGNGWSEATAGFDGDVVPLPFATPIDPSARPLDLAARALPDEAPENHGPALLFAEDPAALIAIAESIGMTRTVPG